MCGTSEINRVLDELESEARVQGDSTTLGKIDTAHYWMQGIVNGNVWPNHEFLLLETQPSAEQARAIIERNAQLLRQRFSVTKL
jgi:hypothetical protein